jgi:hypothetical protein
MNNWRVYFLGVLGLLVAIGGADWSLAASRLPDVRIESWLEPASVVADGRSSTTITLRVTEGGRPRAGDLVQLWIDSGSGIVTPDWVITDSDGMAKTVYTPNVASQYDPHDEARIYAMDIDIGRVVEVGKRELIHVPLIMPDE